MLPHDVYLINDVLSLLLLILLNNLSHTLIDLFEKRKKKAKQNKTKTYPHHVCLQKKTKKQ